MQSTQPTRGIMLAPCVQLNAFPLRCGFSFLMNLSCPLNHTAYSSAVDPPQFAPLISDSQVVYDGPV